MAKHLFGELFKPNEAEDTFLIHQSEYPQSVRATF